MVRRSLNFPYLLISHLAAFPLAFAATGYPNVRSYAFVPSPFSSLKMPPGISALPPRLHALSSTLPELSSKYGQITIDGAKLLVELSDEMNVRAKEGKALTESELKDCVNSLKNVSPADASTVDWENLLSLLAKVAHRPHKDWTKTMDAASGLRNVLLGDADGLTDEFKVMFHRVLSEGNWDGAASHAHQHNNKNKPWAVLVTGVNGCRKTTSMYQPWIEQLLKEALVVPPGGQEVVLTSEEQKLPIGENSFFRQLDHMIATLANQDFLRLYELTGNALGHGSDDRKPSAPSPDDVKRYSNFKAAIFTRYRTLSEILGIMLVREARMLSSNVMIETSGRDIAMFKYVDENFPSEQYNKLALHFTINDIGCAETSVDTRMIGEIETGIKAMQKGDVQGLIEANAGGPYGSEVLKGVQADSDRVWNDIISDGEGSSDVGADWYKATIAINASLSKDWTANAIRPDGTKGTVFAFGPKR